MPDFVSNLVFGWESPYWRGFYDRLAQSFRLILFDKRGTGLSDLGGQFPTFETRMEDVRAVLDAVGSSSAVLLGSHDGCSMAILYAATYPERTKALVLFHPAARPYEPSPLVEISDLTQAPRRLGHPGVLRRAPGVEQPDALRERGRSALVRELAAGRRDAAGRIRV